MASLLLELVVSFLFELITSENMLVFLDLALVIWVVRGDVSSNIEPNLLNLIVYLLLV